MPKLLINGKIASLAQTEFAFFHGNSVFTTLRSKGGKLCHWPLHWQRLTKHAQHFSYSMPFEQEVIELIAPEIAHKDQKIRVIIYEHSFALSFEDYLPPDKKIYEGVSIIISSLIVHPQLSYFKTGNSLPYMQAAKEAQNAQVFEALLCNQYGFVVDGSRTGLLFYDPVKEMLFSLSGGLESVMRKTVTSYASNLGIKCQYTYLKPEQLKSGQLLLTNSLLGLVPVAKPASDTVARLINTFRQT